MRSRHLLRVIATIATVAAVAASVFVAGCAKQATNSVEPDWPVSSRTTTSSDTQDTAPIGQTLANERLPHAKQPGELGRSERVTKSEPDAAERKAGRKDHTKNGATTY